MTNKQRLMLAQKTKERVQYIGCPFVKRGEKINKLITKAAKRRVKK